jgi:hypothetical protein
LIALAAFLLSGCYLSHGLEAESVAPDAGEIEADAGPYYCAVYERDCFCFVAASNLVCLPTRDACEVHRETRDAGAPAQSCTLWTRRERADAGR